MHKRNKLVLCYGRKKKKTHQDLIRLILPDYPAVLRENSGTPWEIDLSLSAMPPATFIFAPCEMFYFPADFAHMNMKTCGLEDHEDDLLFF